MENVEMDDETEIKEDGTINYESLYKKYKDRYINLQNITSKLQKWPTLACDNYFTDVIDADKCVLDSHQIEINPYYETDKINGYTNNGFYEYWGNKPQTFSNVQFIEVKNAEDISKYIKFAAKYDKIVIVKNTGHDYIGRSFPVDNSIVLWTHRMSNIYWQDTIYIIDENNKQYKITDHTTKCINPNFGKCVEKPDENYKYGFLTVDAGVQWYKVFDYMMKNKKKNNVIDNWAMKGASNTVGAAGGWILDGGFGLFPKLNGMGVDNVLAMEVVLANGDILNISKYSNAELFKAFRGGGACNFGIVSKVTYKILPKLDTFGDIFLKINVSNSDLFINSLIVLFKSKFLIQKYFGGAIQIKKNSIEMFISFANLEFEQAKKYMTDFIAELNNVGITIDEKNIVENININISSSNVHKWTENLCATISMQPTSTFIDSPNQEISGKSYTPSSQRWWTYESFNDHIVAFGSRYLSIEDVNKPEECAKKFIDILDAGAPMMQLEISKGMYGAPDDILTENKLTSVHPEVRKAVGLLYIRSYLVNFRPNTNQIFKVNINVKETKQKINTLTEQLNSAETNKKIAIEDILIKLNNLIIEAEKPIRSIKFKYEDNNNIFPDFETKIKYFTEDFTDDNLRSQEVKKYYLEGVKKSSEKTNKGIQKMRDTFKSNATYINHSDCNEPNWQTTFWDKETYNFLVQMKKKYDPNNMFDHRYSIEYNEIK